MKNTKKPAEPSPVVEDFEIRDQQGRLRQKYTMRDRELDGPFYLYDEHNRILQESSFVNGKLDGEQKIYLLGQLRAVNHFKNGKLHGLIQLFGNNGQLASSASYVDGLAHGESVDYSASGAIARRAQYDQGRLHGEVVTYYPDGKVQSLFPYVHDLIEGEVVQYAPDGSEIERVLYHAGKPIDGTGMRRTA